jgi:hypothetical protein
MCKSAGLYFICFMAIIISGCEGGGATGGDPLGTDGITVEASATSLSAGQESVITATVVRLNGLPATDRDVSFTFSTNNTGGTLRVVNDQVDGQGKAVAVYTAGYNSHVNDVQDTIQASLSNDAAAAVVITRIATSIFVGYVVTVTSTPSTLTTRTGVSLITANVKDNIGTNYVNAPIAFTVTVAGGGTATVTSPATTDGNGNAISTYRSFHTEATSDIVTATIIGTTITGATIITVP